MKLKALFSFKSKLSKPYTKLVCIFFRFDKPFCIRRPPRFCRHRLRTKVVRFRKPLSLQYIPQCQPRAKLKQRKPIYRRGLRFRRGKRRTKPSGDRFGEKIAELLSVFRSLGQSKELEQPMESVSVSEAGNGKEPFPSPITPAYVWHSASSKKDSSDDLDDVEDACRSFENYLVEMIVEEGKPRDLMDVEDFIYCWKNLKCAVFAELVCRFYGELCSDLFSPEYEDETRTGE
ncbi:hypothetical protein Nepgr_013065 [Nepenthes gracilis]|uniref:OVATE domain-containing protein n=1 Tax=Nepenthes gracilis TaxID=150966 RepID=A0AAD3SIH4_NEPGR|nr:hypothetical protein Nepgr_013065 [Nepenthes gracilis]